MAKTKVHHTKIGGELPSERLRRQVVALREGNYKEVARIAGEARGEVKRVYEGQLFKNL